MRKNKCTLIIDGNWLLISRFSVINGGFELNSDERIKLKSQSELEELMARSINIVLNRFQDIDNVILVTDGGSWRKQLPVPNILKDSVYKGNRTQSKELDWKYIYAALNALSDRCKKLGITVANHSAIEGDDWVWYWTRKLNAEGTSCIIWSSDNDLKQLIQTNPETAAFTAWYNDRNGIWFDNSYNDSEEVDLLEYFMRPVKPTSTIYESVKTKAKPSYTDPATIVMDKIICGDAGDNIKSVAIVNKNGRNFKITSKLWDEIRNALNINTLEEFFNSKQNIINSIISKSKFIDYNPVDIDDMISYNTKLVWLNEDVIPETIMLYMNQCDYKVVDINYIRMNYKVMCEANNTIEDIFDSI
jgi:5'-3' exonuclease